MGVPVNTIGHFENILRSERRQKFVLVILVNAASDSRAAQQVLRNFHVMDMISDDVDFYLPGYGVDKNQKHLMDRCSQEELERRLKYLYPDFHNSDRYCEVIRSPRLGDILFNIAEFTDFVMEFTRRKKGYQYLGGCEMILLSTDSNNMPDYENSSIYDLDAVVNSPYGPSLDAFLHRTFQIIRRGETIIDRVDVLYAESSRSRSCDENYEIVIKNIIVDLNNCLQWDITVENFYFISYSSKNVMKAELLKKTLQSHGIYVWIAPDGIPQGREYPVIIPTTLKLAKNFVLLLTPESARSQWVRRELAIAVGNSANTKIKVLLDDFFIEDIRRDNELEFLLDRVQIKYTYKEVIETEDGFNRFIQ